MLHDQVSFIILCSLYGVDENWERCITVLAERPRRRKLQQISQEVSQGLRNMYNEIIQKFFKEVSQG